MLQGRTGKTRRGADRAFRRRYYQENRSIFNKYQSYFVLAAIFVTVVIFGLLSYAFIFTNTSITNPLNDTKTSTNNVNDKQNNKNNINGPIANDFPTVPQFAISDNQNRLTITDRIKIPSLTTAYGDINVVYRIYKDHQCNDTDKNGYITVTVNEKNVGSNGSLGCVTCNSLCEAKFPDGSKITPQTIGSIMIISGTGELDIYEDCGFERYHSTLYKFDQCVRMYSFTPTRGIKVVSNTLVYPQPQPLAYAHDSDEYPPLQPHVMQELETNSNNNTYNIDCAPYLVLYSCESSRYFGYQTQANYFGYLTSSQNKNSKFLRLLTSSKIDDLASYVPTYTVKRHPYSRRYSPLNKADSLFKFYQSAQYQALTNDIEVIAVIDPDNWIIRDISKWVKQVSKGHPIAEAAWFHGNELVTQLWKRVCLRNCDFELDLVGVPYFIHKDDLKQIAPWFRRYILIMKDLEESDRSLVEEYKNIQMGWGTEMFGYVFAAAHVGIKHTVIRGAQIRDVSERLKTKEEELSISMIHMGRIWFPWEYEAAKQWWHTEGRPWKRFGAQVWCKCNWTASDIIPWPIAPNTDFQSRHTLYNLHESREFFGEMPECEMRHKGPSGYGRSYP